MQIPTDTPAPTTAEQRFEQAAVLRDRIDNLLLVQKAKDLTINVDPELAKRRTPHGSGLGVYRWVVERTHAWLSKCRGILVRYAKKSSNYLGIIQLACALLWYRRQHRLDF